MEESEIKRIVDNEKEWRHHILKMQVEQSKEIKVIRKDMFKMKIMVVGGGSFFGVVGAYIKSMIGGNQ